MNSDNTINLLCYLSNTDVAVVLISLAITFFCAYKAHHYKPKSSYKAEYLVMGRSLSLPFFIATLVSTWYGGIIGVTQISYEHGIFNFFTQGVFWYISYIIFIFFFIKKIRKNQPLSLIDIVRKNLGKKSSLTAAIFIFFKTLPITYAISLGIVIKMFINISLDQCIVIGTIFVAGYSYFGGFRAVVYSDAIQFILMYAGIIALVICSMYKLGGIDYLVNNLPSSHFKITSKFSITDTLIWLFIACSVTFINPAFYQRVLSAKDDKTAIYGIAISILIWCGFDICTTVCGLYARAYIGPNKPNEAFLLYSMQTLPSGFRGLLLASILATILSTYDSFLVIAKSIIMFDLPKLSIIKVQLRKLLALAITIILLIIISCAFKGDILKVWKYFKSYFSACILVPLIFSILWPKYLRDLSFVCVCTISCTAMIIWDLLKLDNLCGSYYIGTILSLTSLSLSYFTEKHRGNINYSQQNNESLEI